MLNLNDLWATPSECAPWWIQAINFCCCAAPTCDPAIKTIGTCIFCCKSKWIKNLWSLAPGPSYDLYPGCNLCWWNKVDLQNKSNLMIPCGSCQIAMVIYGNCFLDRWHWILYYCKDEGSPFTSLEETTTHPSSKSTSHLIHHAQKISTNLEPIRLQLQNLTTHWKMEEINLNEATAQAAIEAKWLTTSFVVTITTHFTLHLYPQEYTLWFLQSEPLTTAKLMPPSLNQGTNPIQWPDDSFPCMDTLHFQDLMTKNKIYVDQHLTHITLCPSSICSWLSFNNINRKHQHSFNRPDTMAPNIFLSLFTAPPSHIGPSSFNT